MCKYQLWRWVNASQIRYFKNIFFFILHCLRLQLQIMFPIFKHFNQAYCNSVYYKFWSFQSLKEKKNNIHKLDQIPWYFFVISKRVIWCFLPATVYLVLRIIMLLSSLDYILSHRQHCETLLCRMWATMF